MTTLTYGNLPTFAEFKNAFVRECPDGTYRIRLCKTDSERCEGFRLGDGQWTDVNLYLAISEIVYVGYSDMQDLVSSILETLGFEWV